MNFKLKDILKNTGITIGKIVDNMVTGGAVTNAIEDTVDNPKGKFDWLKFVRVIISATIPTYILILLAKGSVTPEQLESWIEPLKSIIRLFGF